LLRASGQRPRGRRAAGQRDEFATPQLIELHSVPAARPKCKISNWEGSVSAIFDSTPAAACCNVSPDFVEPCLPSQVTKPRSDPTGFTRSSTTALHVTTFGHVPTESSRREKSCDADK
jgi:hypothetical protein